jgi:hypothetical protein
MPMRSLSTMEPYGGNSIAPGSQSRGRTRNRYCGDCPREVSTSNWTHHVGSRSHTDNCFLSRSDLGRRSEHFDFNRSRTRSTETNSRDSDRKAFESFEPSVPIQDLRRCAAVVFGSAAESYEALWIAARLLAPGMPLLVHQCMAVAAEMFGPSLRAAARDDSPCEFSPNASLRRPVPLLFPAPMMRRCHSCPPQTRLSPVAVDSTPRVTQIIEKRTETLSAVMSETKRPMSPVCRGTPSQESPAAFEHLFTNLASLNTSLNLDGEPASAPAINDCSDLGTQELVTVPIMSLSEDDMVTSVLSREALPLRSTSALSCTAAELSPNLAKACSQDYVSVDNVSSSETSVGANMTMLKSKKHSCDLEVSVSLTRIPVKQPKRAAQSKTTIELSSERTIEMAKRKRILDKPANSPAKVPKSATFNSKRTVAVKTSRNENLSPFEDT